MDDGGVAKPVGPVEVVLVGVLPRLAAIVLVGVLPRLAVLVPAPLHQTPTVREELEDVALAAEVAVANAIVHAEAQVVGAGGTRALRARRRPRSGSAARPAASNPGRRPSPSPSPFAPPPPPPPPRTRASARSIACGNIDAEDADAADPPPHARTSVAGSDKTSGGNPRARTGAPRSGGAGRRATPRAATRRPRRRRWRSSRSNPTFGRRSNVFGGVQFPTGAIPDPRRSRPVRARPLRRRLVRRRLLSCPLPGRRRRRPPTPRRAGRARRPPSRRTRRRATRDTAARLP